MAVAYVGIGSNLGDRQAHIARALEILREDEDLRVLEVSSMIESAAEGGPEGQDDYLNGALKIETDLTPTDLLSRLKGVERRLGRLRTEERNAPRTMDLDILFYDDVVIIDGKSLSIPHPRLADREFVLRPLCEIAPELVHPRLGRSVSRLLEELQERRGARR